MKRALVGAGLLALLYCAAGCGVDLGFQLDTQPPLPTTVTATAIKINEGVAVGVTALDGKDPIDSGTKISFAPGSPILEIRPTSAPERFVILGVAQGKTTVRVTINGDDYSSIPAEVLAQ